MISLTYQKILPIIAFLLTLMPTLTLAQDAVYDGQVIDKKTGLAVPNVSVILLKEKVGTQTNEQGYYKLIADQKIANDTLVFSSVGYNTYKLAAAAHQRQMFIILEPVSTQLGQVNINNKKIQELTLERFSISDIKDVHDHNYNYSTTPFSVRSSYAKLFVSPQSNAVLASVQLGRRNFDIPQYLDQYPLTTNNRYTRFLMHILALDLNNGGPGEITFTKEISLKDNSLLVNIDLSDDKIVIPDTQFFVSIEWMHIPMNEVIRLDHAPKAEKTRKDGSQRLQDESQYSVLYQPFIVRFAQRSSAQAWVAINNKWQRYIDPDNNIALSATVHY